MIQHSQKSVQCHKICVIEVKTFFVQNGLNVDAVQVDSAVFVDFEVLKYHKICFSDVKDAVCYKH